MNEKNDNDVVFMLAVIGGSLVIMAVTIFLGTLLKGI